MKQAMNFKCNSPKMVCDLLKKYVGNGPAQDDIVALDIGAGNGMVGEHLSAMGAETIVGVDILSEAADALERDRPGLYDAYHVADLSAMAQT